jgi:hypothetical protein
MRTLKKLTTLCSIILISSMSAFAQTEEISDNELKQFVTAFQQIQVINQQTQEAMIKAVKEEGLEVERYNEIQASENDTSKVTEATAEEMEKYKSAKQKLEKLQIESQPKMQEKIIEAGLTIPRYQEIVNAIQASPELQQKVQEYMKGQ